MNVDYDKLREEYLHASLDEADMAADPIDEFGQWFQQAIDHELPLPNAMVLATVKEGRPDALCPAESYDRAGFVFFTHSVSAKGQQLARVPHAALVFYWSPLHRQVRIEGEVEQVSDAEADEYFASRPYGSRVAVLVAPQSSTVPDQEFLEQRMLALEADYPDDVPRPDTWVGYRVRPARIEFWQGRESRLHDRMLYSRKENGGWEMKRLAP